jgi:superfamily II DNA or RNA helicase
MSSTLWQEREYQQQAIENALEALKVKQRALWVMPTGSGKSYCSAELARRYIETDRSRRVLVLIDREKLVGQLVETFKRVLTGVSVGCACAGISDVIGVNSKVLIGTRQTIHPRLKEIGKFDLLIPDEFHDWPPFSIGEQSSNQYHEILAHLMAVNGGNIDILAQTATPHRLGYGLIYGKSHVFGKKNLFENIDYECKYRTLFDAGQIVEPVFLKEVCVDRSKLAISSTGEFEEASTSETMARFVKEAVKVYMRELAKEAYTLIFACDIDHCESIANELIANKIKAYAMHSKSKGDVFQEYVKTGGCLVTVGQAIKGFDFPPITGGMLLRPTNAPAILIQMIGRFLRKFSGEVLGNKLIKESVKIIDLVGNIDAHLTDNDLDRPIYKSKKNGSGNGDDKERPVQVKFCGAWPKCKVILPKSARRCVCGFSFMKAKEDKRQVRDLVEHKHADSAGCIIIDNPSITSYISRQYSEVYLMITLKSSSGVSYRHNLTNDPLLWKKLVAKPMPAVATEAARVLPKRIKKATVQLINDKYKIIDIEK